MRFLVFLLLIHIPLMRAQVNQVEELKKCYALFQKYYSQGEYNLSLPYVHKAFSISKSVLGTHHETTLALMIKIAATYDKLGKHKESEILYKQAIAWMEKKLGKLHPHTLAARNNLAVVYKDQGKYKKAMPLYLQNLKLEKQKFGANHPKTLLSLNNLASLYHAQSKYKEAEALYSQVLKFRKQKLGLTHPHTIASIRALGVIYKTQKKHKEAELLLLQAFQLAKKLSNGLLATVGLAKDLAIFYGDCGKYDKAESWLLQTLQLIKKHQITHPETIEIKRNLAEVYVYVGKYKQAESLFLEALQTSKQKLGKNHPYTTACTNSLAMLYSHQKKLKSAESLLQSKQNSKSTHLQDLDATYNLAMLYFRQGKYEQAEPLFLKALKLKREKLGETHPDTITAINNLTALYYKQGKYEQAEPLLLQTLEVSKKKLGQDHPTTLVLMDNLSVLYGNLGKYKKSEALILKALELSKNAWGEMHPTTLTLIVHTAQLYLRKKQYKEARKFYKEWFFKKSKYLFDLLSGLDHKKHEHFLQEDQNFVKEMLSVFLTPENVHAAEDIFSYSLIQKDILLHLASQHAGNINLEKQKLLKEKRNKLSHLLLRFPKATSGRLKTDIGKLQDEIKEIEIALSKKDMLSRNLLSITTKIVQQSLSNREMIIDFLVANAANMQTKRLQPLLVVTVVKKNAIKLIKLGKLKPIKELVEEYRFLVSNPSSAIEQIHATGYKLYLKIWKPLLKHLNHKSTIYINSDNCLRLLPFSALVNHKKKYLLEIYNIQQVSSFRFNKNHTSSNTSATIFACPNYGMAEQSIHRKNNSGMKIKNLYFKSLSATVKEGKAITKRLIEKQLSVKNYFKKNATKENFMDLSSPKILHLATHVFFLGEPFEQTRGIAKISKNPVFELDQNKISKSKPKKAFGPLTQTGLAFATANLSQTEIVSAWKIAFLNLQQTELVVLSSCDTTSGEKTIAKSIYSLHWAFHKAGTKAICYSLWPGDDTKRRQLINIFYRLFLNKVSPQVALRYAQLQIKQEDPHPYHWANLVMTGMDKHFSDYKTNISFNFSKKTNINYFWFIGIFVVAIILFFLNKCRGK